MDRNLIILCIPISGLGHIKSSAEICYGLQERGHKVVLAVEKSWKGYFSNFGFEEILYEEHETKEDEDAGEFWNNFIRNVRLYYNGDYEFRANFIRISFETFVNNAKFCNETVRKIINDVKPDIILHDNYVAYPAIVNSGIPYVILWSANPLVALCSPNLPPIDSDEPINDTKNWKNLTEIRTKSLSDLWTSFNDWTISMGLPGLKKPHFQYDSKYLNVLMYPKVLFDDYAKRLPLAKNIMLLEHSIRLAPADFKLPHKLANRPGKLIYFSLGSIASNDRELMIRLINMLSKSKHRFIISMGANIIDEDLAENMWGQKILPQLEVLKIANAFITHGGNNSIRECLYFGVPAIVMPLFMDQYSNAQRIVEMKLGIKLNPITVTEDELLPSIDSIVNDMDLLERMSVVSNQMKNSKSFEEIVDRIEKIGKSN